MDILCAHCGCSRQEHDEAYCREFVENDEDCWCKPTLFFDGGEEFGNVWVHKANADELPPAKILIEAVADAIAGS